jgi:hypothetical protein
LRIQEVEEINKIQDRAICLDVGGSFFHTTTMPQKASILFKIVDEICLTASFFCVFLNTADKSFVYITPCFRLFH